MKLFSDYHMHPQAHKLQPYSQELLQPWADRARLRGITDFAITDHDRYHEAVDFDQIDIFRDRNPDLNIRAGIELDNDPKSCVQGRAWVDRHWDRLDFVLGSVHYIGNWPFDHADHTAEFGKRNIDEVYEQYIAELDRMIVLGHVDSMAHLDLIKIFKFFPTVPLVELFTPVLEKIAHAGLAMEISTAGWRKPIGIQYPDEAIVRKALELGIPITIASDAHAYTEMSKDYEKLAEFLKLVGVREIAIFEKHKPTLVSIV
ncbi:MAG TPA: histidinol-phosphatase HisJ family protein [Candidatus Methylacidiphilales bacterium]|nr:histidinol-phosphatase HisJ family protein [Candidatus Methylacidiphilales bacterium]